MHAAHTSLKHTYLSRKKERKKKTFTKYATVVTVRECERLCAKYSSTSTIKIQRLDALVSNQRSHPQNTNTNYMPAYMHVYRMGSCSLPLSLFNSCLSLSLFNVPRARHQPRPTRLQLLSWDDGVSYLLRCRGSRQLERILLFFGFGCEMKLERHER